MQVLKWFDGKKTLMGAVTLLAMFGPQISEEVGKLIVEGGGDPSTFLKIAGYVLTVVGIAHKVYKAAKPAEVK